LRPSKHGESGRRCADSDILVLLHNSVVLGDEFYSLIVRKFARAELGEIDAIAGAQAAVPSFWFMRL
jgi:hypothetical protein